MATDETQAAEGTELLAQQVAGGEPPNAQLVDVRTDEEVAASRIPGSVHIPLDRLQAEAEQLDKGRPVVFYCRGGDRSASAADAFRASGWEAFHISGGILQWAERGLPLEPEGAAVGERSNLPPR